MDHTKTTTAFEIKGYSIVRNLGVVRGILVRSRSIFGSIGAGLQTIIGGNINVVFQNAIRHTTETGFV